MEAVHHLLDVGDVVPEVDVEDVDVGRAEPLETALDGEHERLGVVAGVVDLLLEGVISPAEVVRVLQTAAVSFAAAIWCAGDEPWS